MRAKDAGTIFIFAEDPGAANYILQLPGLLRAKGWNVCTAATGIAAEYLSAHGVEVDRLAHDCDFGPILSRIGARLVIAGTAQSPEASGLALFAAAKASNLPAIALIDASTGLDERFRGRTSDPLFYCPQFVIVPDETSRQSLHALGLSDGRILVAGHPHWDYVRAKRVELDGADRVSLRENLFGASLLDKRVIVFGAEIYDGLHPEEHRSNPQYRLTGDRESQDRTEIVIEEFLLAVRPWRRDVHLVLRLHPKNRLSDLSAYHADFDLVSKDQPALELMYASDAIVGMTSMLLIEASLLCKPTLSILPRESEIAWLPTIAAGITPCALDRTSIAREIAALLDRPRMADQAAVDRLFPRGALQKVTEAVEAYVESASETRY